MLQYCRRLLFPLCQVSLVGLCLLGAPATFSEPAPTGTPFQVVASGFEKPTGLVVHPDGDLFLTDRKAGVLYRLTPALTPSGDPAFTSRVVYAGLDVPTGVAVEQPGHLLVAEHGADRVVRLTKLNGVFASPEPVVTGLKEPRWLALDADGVLFLSAEGLKPPKGAKDHPKPKGDLVVKVAQDGSVSVLADRFTRLRGLTLDHTGALWAAAERRGGSHDDDDPEGSIFKIRLPQGDVALLIQQGFAQPSDLKVDTLGALFFTAQRGPGRDARDDRHRAEASRRDMKADEDDEDHDEDEDDEDDQRPAPGVILKATFTATGTLDTLTVLAAGLGDPAGLVFDRDGHLYVAEQKHRRVLRFDAPAPPVLDPPVPAFTRNATLRVQGTAEPHARITVLGGASPARSLAAGTTGTFAIDVPLTPNTEQRLKVYATRARGTGLTSAATEATVTQDAVPPETLITGGPAATHPSTTATFAFRGTDNVTPPEQLRFAHSVDSAPFSPFTTLTTVTLTNLTPGLHTFRVKARDQADNEDPTPAEQSFSVVTGLTITGITPTSGSIGSSVTITGSGFDPTSGGTTVTFGGNAVATIASATTTELRVTVPATAETGPISVRTAQGTAQGPVFTVLREQDFGLTVAPGALGLLQGSTTLAQVQLVSTGTQAFTGLAALTVEGLPIGVTAGFEPATLSAFQPGTLRLTASSTAASGSVTLTVRAQQGALVRTSPLTLAVAANAGTTGVKGRFVTPEGSGIAGVIVRADITAQPQVSTDAAGNFLLTGLPPGLVTLRMDATPANPLYPMWPYMATLGASQITLLPDWTINPPPTEDKFVPINNATQTQVITDPRFPGLEIRLPAGVTITGWDGVLKTRIAIEKIMPDKLPVSPPPFPIREAYQLYFGSPMGGLPSAPIPVTLPNVAELEPGEETDILYYDGSPMGLGGLGEWKIAGRGTVSPDGKTVVSNPGVGIPRFCGVCGLMSLSCPPPNKPKQPPPDDCPVCGKPIDLFTGQELMSMELLNLNGLTPIELRMKYNPVDAFNNRAGTVGSVGFGWVLSYDVAFLPFEGPQKRLVMPGSKFVNFVDDGSGNYKNTDDPRFGGAVIRATNLSANEWELTFRDGHVWRFKPFPGIPDFIRGGPPTFVTEMADPAGSVLPITRQSNGRITAIGPPERQVTMTYGANSFVNELRDTANRTVRFTYTATNRIQTVTDPDGKVTRFTYVDDTEVPTAPACAGSLDTDGERIKTVLYPGKATPTENFYGPSRRILRQVAQDGREYRVAYKVTGACVTHVSAPTVKCPGNCPDVDSWENFQAGWRIHGGRLIGTTVTEPSGSTTTYAFTAKGLTPDSTNAEGQATRNKYNPANRLIERTDVIGRTWRYQYDEKGNVTQTTDPLGRIVNYTYDGKWNKVISITRFLSDNTPVVTQLQYEQATGNLIRITDPLGNFTAFGYTARGQLATVTLPGDRTTTFAYNAAGDLIGTTDPLGNEVQLATDGAGRPIQFTDALGFTNQTEYNGVSSVTQITDALNQVTRFGYDAAGRPTSVTNQLNNAIETYQYDDGDRLTRLTDALSRFTTFEYDPAGRRSRMTDRKGQVTVYGYDAQDRLVRLDHPGSTETRAYDAVGRLTEVRDNVSAVSYTYDAADRVVRVATETAAGRHEVSYAYDTLDRITRRTVNGADPTDYGYDNASRLTSITYRGQTTTYAWDNASRLVNRTLPNGIVQAFSYDNADRVTQIQYTKTNETPIETISYTYDANGRRLSKSTSTASVQETLFAATYDAANRLTSLTLDPGTPSAKTFTLSYDANGNLVRKERQGTGEVTTYSWDTRNRLVGIAAPGLTASFSYDVFGRRASKIVNGSPVEYVYDGLQAIGEIRNGALDTTLLTGLEIDEVIARYAQTGNRVYLTDALGNVLAQTREDQAIQNAYAFSPYGETTILGTDEGNPIQYTARENDGTGLYFYRARYYDPLLKRFIQEDPIGIIAGINLYAYVDANPNSFTDPTGLELVCNYVIGYTYERKGRYKIKEEVAEWVKECSMVPKHPAIHPPDPTESSPRRPERSPGRRGGRGGLPFPVGVEFEAKCEFEKVVTQPAVWEERIEKWRTHWYDCIDTCTGKKFKVGLPDQLVR